MFRLGGASAVFTNRYGGVSPCPYDSLNLAFHTGDDDRNVRANRQRVCAAIGRRIVWMHQTHSNRVHVLQPGHTDTPVEADGVIVSTAPYLKLGLIVPALAVMVADCVPVLLATADGNYLSVLHAGRAGLVKGIIREAIKQFTRLGVAGEHLHAAIGPSICGKCYEVPQQLQDFVVEKCPSAWSRTRDDRPGLNVRAGVVAQLQSYRVNVSFVSKRCTYEQANLYSYRRQKKTGRFAGIVFPPPS